MTNIIDFKLKKDVSIEEWSKDVFEDKELQKTLQGVAAVLFHQDGSVDFALKDLNSLEILWCARKLEQFAFDLEEN